MGTSKTKVEKARTILDSGDKKAKIEILEGKKSIHRAYREKQPKSSLVKVLPGPRRPTIDQVCTEIIDHLNKASAIMESKKLYENFTHIDGLHIETLELAMQRLWRALYKYKGRLNLKLLEEVEEKGSRVVGATEILPDNLAESKEKLQEVSQWIQRIKQELYSSPNTFKADMVSFIREIYHDSGLTYQQIADVLNEANIPYTPGTKNSTWDCGTVQNYSIGQTRRAKSKGKT